MEIDNCFYISSKALNCSLPAIPGPRVRSSCFKSVGMHYKGPPNAS